MKVNCQYRRQNEIFGIFNEINNWLQKFCKRVETLEKEDAILYRG